MSFHSGIEEHFSEKYNTENLLAMRNVAGEIMGAQTAIIDFYFRNDGSVTIKPMGINIEISKKLKNLIEAKSFKNKHENSNCSFSPVDKDTFSDLVEYLKSVEKIELLEDRRIESPAHRHLKFKSTFGDTMVVNLYDTGKLLLQGNPAYIFTETLYFMSLLPSVSLEDMIKKKNEVYESNITVDDAKKLLQRRIPNAYDKMDEKILKLLSPSISLSNSPIKVEEYSCFIFPALKALEALLLNLLLKKELYLSSTINFGSFFKHDSALNKHVLIFTVKQKINDSSYAQCLENIYNYFKQNRHIYFHANQILSLTEMIHDKTKADAILNDILILIDDTGNKIL